MALYNIFNGVSTNEFHLVATCKHAKELEIFILLL